MKIDEIEFTISEINQDGDAIDNHSYAIEEEAWKAFGDVVYTDDLVAVALYRVTTRQSGRRQYKHLATRGNESALHKGDWKSR